MKSGVLAVALAGALAMPVAGAQSEQTAAGAQKFLSLLLTEGTVPVFVHFREVAYRVDTKTWEKKMLRGWVDYRSDSTAVNHPREVKVERTLAIDPCTTSVTALAFSNDDRKAIDPPDYNAEYYTSETRYVPAPAQAMAPPHNIPWGKVTVSRGPGGVVASVADPRFKQVSLIYRTTDAALQERIEYAMKFLQMSCDATAATGF